MQFYSPEYIFVFLPFVAIIYFLIGKVSNKINHSIYWLILCSLVFYGIWDLKSMPILLTSIVLNYFFAAQLIKTKSKKLLILGLILNIFSLEFYKFHESVAVFIGVEMPKFALPLAISFFSITQIAYLVDCYQGLVKKQDWRTYSLFVLFFPHLIIGPIVLNSELVPQLEDPTKRVVNWDNVISGAILFFVGFLKKMAIANTLATFADTGFTMNSPDGFIPSWLTTLAFSLQLYFDFSGYSDMAIGSAQIFNIEFLPNFNSPFKSTSLIQFWSRWHISLTSILNTYIYSPLMRMFRPVTFSWSLIAVFITFFASSFWHGPRLTYFLFGALQGIFLALNHAWRRKKMPMNNLLGWALTFVFCNIMFVIFRSESIEIVLKILANMTGLNGLGRGLVDFKTNMTVFAVMAAGFVIVFLPMNSNTILKYAKGYLKADE